MKNTALSFTAFVITVLAVVATLVLIAFSETISRGNLERMAWACFGLAIFGTILGFSSFKTQLGKTSAILGTLVVLGFLVQLLRGS